MSYSNSKRMSKPVDGTRGLSKVSCHKMDSSPKAPKAAYTNNRNAYHSGRGTKESDLSMM